jgi:transposase
VSAISRGTRRIVVAHLTDHGMTPAEIAAELGVSDDTVRRDIREWTPPAPVVEPEDAAAPAPGLLLPESTQLRQDLNILATAFRAQPEDAARFAIHQLAEQVRTRWQAQVDARANLDKTPQETRS